MLRLPFRFSTCSNNGSIADQFRTFTARCVLSVLIVQYEYSIISSDFFAHWHHFGEQFMVRENPRISREPVETSGFFDTDNVQSYWEGRHTLHPPNIPVFLARDADRVLSTGKYLNVVRHCITRARCSASGGAALASQTAAAAAQAKRASPDKLSGTLWDAADEEALVRSLAEDEQLVVPRAAALMYTRCDTVGSDLERAIEPAYQFAADRLIQLLMRQYDLAARFRYELRLRHVLLSQFGFPVCTYDYVRFSLAFSSIKHYFLLDRGDFVFQFFDVTEEEMKKPYESVLTCRLYYTYTVQYSTFGMVM